MTLEHTSLNSLRKPNWMSNHDVSKVSRCQRATSWFVVPLSSARGLPAWLLFCVHFFFLCVPPHDRIPDCQYETRAPQVSVFRWSTLCCPVLCAHRFSASVLSCAQIERRMELVRVVSHNTHKRMVSCLQGHIGADAEKRHVRPLTRRNQTDPRLTLSCVNQLRPDRAAAATAGSPVVC